MLGRRFLLIVALLMGMTALAASLAPQDPRVRSGAEPTPEPTSTPALAPADTTRVVTISADERGQRVVVEEGELIELRVTGSTLDTVSVEGLGDPETVDAESDAVFNLLAELPDDYPIVLLEAERRIGTLVIR